ncbi:MAG: hypothetical protein ACK5MT_04115 [Actinomycetales bacterium]
MDATSLAAVAAKAGLVWVRSAPGQAWAPVWFVWHDEAIHVVTGGGEQPDPFAALPALIEVRLPSKDSGAAVIDAGLHAHVLPPGTAAWTEAATALAQARLNSHLSDPPETWATDSRLIRLDVPGSQPSATSEPVRATGPDASLPSPVTVDTVRPRGWRPMRAHLRRSKS